MKKLFLKKIYNYGNLYNFYSFNYLNSKKRFLKYSYVKCTIPIISNKINMFHISGILLKQHKNNINKTFTFYFKLNRNFLNMTIPGNSLIFNIIKINNI